MLGKVTKMLRKLKLKNVRIQIMAVMAFLFMYVLATYIVVENYVFSKDVKQTPTVKFEYVVVHLDLKGAPPKLSYLESILPMLKLHGVNGLLIEYEDMFPYEGRLKKLRSRNFYFKEELETYLTAAVLAGFEIIPLIQTFGHLEFALKVRPFSHLREQPKFSDSICPSSPESQMFIHDMLEQVIRFHQKIAPLKHIHVGCDEVYHFNNCTACRKRRLTKAQALTSHVHFVIDTVHSLSPDSTVLIWDDMYRAVKLKDTVDLRFPKTEAVYWDYTPHLDQVTHTNMYKYNQMFDDMWIATAFKGADGPTKSLPLLEARFNNHLSWLNFVYSYSAQRNLYRIKGIILTGWSRYKHFGPLCELLPASIHSLIINLILIQNYGIGNFVVNMDQFNDYVDKYIRSNFSDILYCLKLDENFPKKFDSQSCFYEEADLYTALQNLGWKKSIIKTIITHSDTKYSSDSRNSTNFTAGYEYIKEMKRYVGLYHKMLIELRTDERKVRDLMADYFEKYVIDEYIETIIDSFVVVLNKVIDVSNYDYKRLQLQAPRNNTNNSALGSVGLNVVVNWRTRPVTHL